MKIFDIKELKKHPERKLVLRHYRNDAPEVWAIEEAQITVGDRLLIKSPQTGYDMPEYVLADESYEVRDMDGNPVGNVEFATEELTVEEFAKRLLEMPFGDSIDFTFGIDKNECSFGATKIKRFDAVLIIIAAYGGNESFLFDITDRKDASELYGQLRNDLQDHTGDYLYIDRYPDTGIIGQKSDRKAFQERIEALRDELIQSIIEILQNAGLQRLELSKDLKNPTYVVWHEPQEGVFYDTPVFAVSIHKGGIALDMEESENGFMDTLYSTRGDLACTHLDWLNGLREDLLETLQKQKETK